MRAAGLPLTLNFVVHRHNLGRRAADDRAGAALGAGRIEIAHVQYYGWALRNRAALLPTRAAARRGDAMRSHAARARLRGRLVIDYVVPDYYAQRPKACMGGWAQRFLNVTPAGRVLPCHAAETLPGFDFPSVRDQPARGDLVPLGAVRRAFAAPRGCRSRAGRCDRREIDWGGCRCQAFALTGDAGRTDPACALSPDHALMAAAAGEATRPAPDFVYRRYGANVEPVAG